MRTIRHDQLEPWQRQLLDAARDASRTANCRYSGYPVGAALRVRGRSGEPVVVTGNNSETLHYRSTCAEKHALHRALAEHSWVEDGILRRPRIDAVAVYCARGASPQQPCGDCRQTLYEHEPDLEVVAAAGPGGEGGEHDPRVTVTTLRALLPHGFEVSSLEGELGLADAVIHDGESLEEHVVHLPKPSELTDAAAHRTALLQGVSYLVLVGSAHRARRVAKLAHERFGAPHDAEASCYCDPAIPGRGESGREYAVYGLELEGGARVAVASHGIGPAGVEIVLSELPALLALAADGRAPRLRGALRCGTRGTLARVPLGSVALSTACRNPDLEILRPSGAWLERLRAAARERGLTIVADDETDARGEDGWPPPEKTLVEGPGISTPFFWQGQGRPLYRPGRALPSTEILALERRERAALLARWAAAGIRWIEMEDFTVLALAERCGLPAATLGAVVGHRRAADGSFQAGYGKAALERSELLPPELALAAIRADAEESGDG